MTLPTAFTTLVAVEHPVALAPMGEAAGGALAAGVSNGGGLGLVGGGRGVRDWVERELAIVGGATSKPWGVGFLSWSVDRCTIEHALGYGPSAVLLSFGDPAPLADTVRGAGVTLIVQVTDLDEARRARDVGADVIVAQGGEAGGHGGRRGTLPFVPAVVDLVAPVPVLAAGGIADGRGLAAALVLGAAGALVGSRFLASPEALLPDSHRRAILDRGGDDTERSRVLDIARRSPWPGRYTARTLRNSFLERWREREDDLRADAAALDAFAEADARDDMDVAPVWAGEGIDLVTEITPAGDVVAALVGEAEAALHGAGRRR
ncbi:MAG: NAD(P)H-dependent flavin oxidoreductase [Acidimicrobiales bacterium]